MRDQVPICLLLLPPPQYRVGPVEILHSTTSRKDALDPVISRARPGARLFASVASTTMSNLV